MSEISLVLDMDGLNEQEAIYISNLLDLTENGHEHKKQKLFSDIQSDPRGSTELGLELKNILRRRPDLQHVHPALSKLLIEVQSAILKSTDGVVNIFPTQHVIPETDGLEDAA